MSLLRKLLVSAAALIAATPQTSAQPASPPTWDDTYLDRKQEALRVLSVWAGANVLASSALALAADDTQPEQFGLMTAGWGVVNGALGLLGLRQIRKQRATPRTFDDAFADLDRTEKIFLFNAGLDVAYVLGGAYLIQRSNNLDHSGTRPRDRGWGQAIIVQGAALCLFDLLAYRHVHKSALTVSPVLSADGGVGIGVQFKP